MCRRFTLTVWRKRSANSRNNGIYFFGRIPARLWASSAFLMHSTRCAIAFRSSNIFAISISFQSRVSPSLPCLSRLRPWAAFQYEHSQGWALRNGFRCSAGRRRLNGSACFDCCLRSYCAGRCKRQQWKVSAAQLRRHSALVHKRCLAPCVALVGCKSALDRPRAPISSNAVSGQGKTKLTLFSAIARPWCRIALSKIP